MERGACLGLAGSGGGLIVRTAVNGSGPSGSGVHACSGPGGSHSTLLTLGKLQIVQRERQANCARIGQTHILGSVKSAIEMLSSISAVSGSICKPKKPVCCL